MLFLLDANVLIDANRDYYPLDRVPEFWGWLVFQGLHGRVKIPIEIYEELKNGNDALAVWIKMEETKQALLFEEEVDISLIQIVLDQGYASDLADDEVQRLGRDPFLVAYALKDPTLRNIVTTENSKPRKTRANKHIPDICNSFGISWSNTFEFIKRLGFSTDWNRDL